jgi:hypothetical protein
MSPRAFALACALIAALAGHAAAQATPPDTGAARKAPTALDTTVVTGRTTDLVGVATSANQGTVGAADLALRPLLRPGETVENVPGVIVTQHSGSGKANQYFLRGFNLDHGTDIAISADGVPVNMPSHAHGQGYADLNFVIPELIEAVDYKKGPYYADVGDFGSAGAFNIRYYDKLPAGLATADGGAVGYARARRQQRRARRRQPHLRRRVRAQRRAVDHRRQRAEAERHAALHARRRTARPHDHRDAYHNAWHSTDQVPDRAITEGLISPWGEIDTTDAGNTGRYALSADWHTRNARSSSDVMAYAMHYDLDLFSDFTYFLDDPLHGDQVEQQDNRGVFGAKASHTWIGTLLGAPSEFTAGFQLRDDEIRNGLCHTEARVRLDAVTVNDIGETNAAPYVESRVWWNSWFRTVAGVRLDAFWLDVRNVAGGNAGTIQSTLPSPKLDLVFGPWKNTERYVDGGYGFHSNDARGVVAAVNPATALPRSFGAEVGARTALVPGLQSSVSLWLLDLNSELVWDGDAGEDDPSGPTRRYGVEFSNYYAPLRWLTIDADYAWSHARFTDNEADGNYVPEALVATFDGGVAAHDLGGVLHRLSGGLRWRYFGPRHRGARD